MSFIHTTCAQHALAAIYSALVVDSATEFYFLEDQETSVGPKNWYVLDVLFLSNLHQAKSASAYAISSKFSDFGYHNPRLMVPLRYLRILLTTLSRDILGLD